MSDGNEQDLILDPIIINVQLTIIEETLERLSSLQGLIQRQCYGRAISILAPAASMKSVFAIGRLP